MLVEANTVGSRNDKFTVQVLPFEVGGTFGVINGANIIQLDKTENLNQPIDGSRNQSLSMMAQTQNVQRVMEVLTVANHGNPVHGPNLVFTAEGLVFSVTPIFIDGPQQSAPAYHFQALPRGFRISPGPIVEEIVIPQGQGQGNCGTDANKVGGQLIAETAGRSLDPSGTPEIGLNPSGTTVIGLNPSATTGPDLNTSVTTGLGLDPSRTLREVLDPSEPEPYQEPIYVNAKQYDRILKRRIARDKLQKSGRVQTRKAKYMHESRHKHAMNRTRGYGGRFESGPRKMCPIHVRVGSAGSLPQPGIHKLVLVLPK